MKTVSKIHYETTPLSVSHLILPVKVNSQGPFQFILDTGASVVCLSQTTAKTLKLKGGSTEQALSASGMFDVNLVKTKSLSIGRALRRNMIVAVMDMEDMSEKLGCKIDGILGYDFLKSYQLTIDYPKQVITFKK